MPSNALAPAFRRQSRLDALLGEVDCALRVLAAPVQAAEPSPGRAAPLAELDAAERRHAAGLMRVNHVGEVCAQALYRGQALLARKPASREHLLQAAAEEMDHLAWTEERLTELQARSSLLNPLWYAGAFALGVAAAARGDANSLGFVVETERQVEAHLADHLDRLPVNDARSRAIVARMKDDEARHRRDAEQAGAARLPVAVQQAMRLVAKVMTTTAYRI
jgi:ubiquinone biosynthesis monooxygenase Coq7